MAKNLLMVQVINNDYLYKKSLQTGGGGNMKNDLYYINWEIATYSYFDLYPNYYSLMCVFLTKTIIEV